MKQIDMHDCDLLVSKTTLSWPFHTLVTTQIIALEPVVMIKSDYGQFIHSSGSDFMTKVSIPKELYRLIYS